MSSAPRIVEGLAHDGDPFFDRNDGLHAGFRERALVVHRSDAGAESRRMKNDRSEHLGQGYVDRKPRFAENFRGRVDAKPAFLSNELVRRSGLRFNIRYRKLLRASRK